ncbi:MAG: hypothetical protein V2B19_04885 [Pseudomonadota bacterium]
MKKTLKKLAAIASIAFVGMIGTASAAVIQKTINMCGASAQADFWVQAGEAIVTDTYGCTAVAKDWRTNKGNLIIRGTGCVLDGPGDTGHNDTIYVRYLASNSDGGCHNYDCKPLAYADPATCGFTGTPGTCTGTVSAPCMMGCADVPCNTLCAPYTRGWATGYAGYVAAGSNDSGQSNFNASCIQVTPAHSFSGIIVPFGFIANNAVTHKVCDYTAVEAALAGRPNPHHWAYNKDGWECATVEGGGELACRGDFKCVDNVCQDGNQGTGNARTCTTAADCKYGRAGTGEVVPTCIEKPLDNVSRLMVLHIFSNAVDNWNDFGTSFPNLTITKCMRHAGSGTHQTLLDTVARGDVIISRFSGAANNIWHYSSSSNLTFDCVDRFPGAIGYVDADKAMLQNNIGMGDSLGIHQLKYDGVAPSRYDVTNGKYNFWAAQTCFMDDCVPDEEQGYLTAIQNQSANPQYLTFDNFGQSAYFWATAAEMKVYKTNNDPKDYPKSKPTRP